MTVPFILVLLMEDEAKCKETVIVRLQPEPQAGFSVVNRDADTDAAICSSSTSLWRANLCQCTSIFYHFSFFQVNRRNMCLEKEYSSFLFLIPRGSQKVRSLIANRKHKHSVPADQVGGEWKKQIQQREADVSKTHQTRRLISHLVNQWNTHQEEESFAFGLSPWLSAAHHCPYFCYALPFADKRAIKHRLRPIKVKQCYKILKLCISKRRTATLSSRQKQIKKLIVLSFASSGNRDADKSIGKRKGSLAARGTATVCGRAAASFAKASV